MAAFRAICCISVPLFQSFMCFVCWSMKSLPVYPYGTKKVFSRHVVISSYAFSMVDALSVIIAPLLFRPQIKRGRRIGDPKLW